MDKQPIIDIRVAIAEYWGSSDKTVELMIEFERLRNTARAALEVDEIWAIEEGVFIEGRHSSEMEVALDKLSVTIHSEDTDTKTP